MPTRKLILASASPRRRELLDRLQVSCMVMPAHIDERVQPDEAPTDYVARIALAKARTVAQRLAGEAGRHIVLGADTAVVVDNDILGKPVDRADGLAMLARLSGRSHRVLSAVALVGPPGERVLISDSEVTFRSLTPGEAEAYWATGEPVGKAGAYAIQGLGGQFVAHLTGSYSGVMGLPVFETARLLNEFEIPTLPAFGDADDPEKTA
jgi:septum formation protein